MKRNLSNQEIAQVLDKGEILLKREGVGEHERYAFKFLIEDILLRYKYITEDTLTFNIKFKHAKSTCRIILSINYDEINLLENFDDITPQLKNTYKKILNVLSNNAKYSYSKGSNIYEFYVLSTSTTIIENTKFNLHYMGKYKIAYFVAIFFQIVTVILNIVVPLLTAQIIVAYTDSAIEQIIIVAIAIFFVNLFASFLNWVIVNVYNRVYFNVKKNLISDICQQASQVKNYCLDEMGSGLFVKRLTVDVETMSNGLNLIIDSMLVFTTYIGILIAVLIISEYAFCYVLFAVITCSLLETVRVIHFKKNDRLYKESTENYSNSIIELIRGLKDIKLFNGRKSFVNIVNERVADSNTKGLFMYDKNFKYRFFRDGLSGLFDLGFMVLLGLALYTQFQGTTPAFALVLFNYNSSLGKNVYNSLSAFFDRIKDFNLSTERIIALTKEKFFPKDKFGNRHKDTLTGKIDINNITFAYNHNSLFNKSPNILKNVSLHISPGDHVALVGKTGSGKTTILNLIGKIYDVYDGEILFDGISIQDLDEATIRNNTITINQNAHVFNMSIFDNIKIAKEDAKDEEVKEAAKYSCVDLFVKNLPDGYKTIVGEDGINLSGGQRQRLTIARALLRKCPIIIFDESTSALDNVTQSTVIKNIKEYAKDSTIIMVSHRLSTIKDADKICFIEDGKILDFGTHDYLMQNCERYKDLYKTESL